MEHHNQVVSRRTQALYYNIKSKYKWYYGDPSTCVME